MCIVNKCPYCDSKSGVDIYDRQFCHACHRDFSKPSLIKVKRPQTRLKLPENDPLTIFPEEARKFLKKYDLERDNNCFWSTEYNRLCFCYKESGRILGAWMRSLDGQPKWLMAGKKDFCWIYYKPTLDYVSNSICLVEDVISAIKVSQIIDCICLGGTSINDIIKEKLKQYQNIYLFFDDDDAGKKAAIQIRNKLKINNFVKIIRAKKDPKCYSYEELENLIK